MSDRMLDYLFEDHGSIWMVTPQHYDAKVHLMSNTDGQWFGLSLVVEPRYVKPLAEQLDYDGFIVRIEEDI